MADTKRAVLADAAGILAARDFAYEDVYVPEWRLTVRVRGMTGAQRDAFMAAIAKSDGRGGVKVDMSNRLAKFAVQVIVDAEGRRLFRDDQIGELSAKSAAALERIFNVGQRLSGLSDEAVEALAKNSDGQSDGSTTA